MALWPATPTLGDTYEEGGVTYTCVQASPAKWRTASGIGPAIVAEFITATDAAWVPAAGMRYMEVYSTAAGGGGGGAQATDSDSAVSAGGGGSGETRFKVYTAGEIGATVAVTIGAAGAGGVAAGGTGSTGGTTTFNPAGSGETLSCIGGDGGNGGSAGGYVAGSGGQGGDSGTGGTQYHFNAGNSGGFAHFSGGTHRIQPGKGGSSPWGGAGITTSGTSSIVGGTATGYGSGGAGAGNVNNGTDRAGGAGFAGMVFVKQYLGESYGETKETFSILDGVTAPGTVAGSAQIYVDTSDGDLKVKFGDGTVKTIVVDT